MASKVSRKMTINAKGVIEINGDVVSIWIEDEEQPRKLSELFADLNGKESTIAGGSAEEL